MRAAHGDIQFLNAEHQNLKLALYVSWSHNAYIPKHMKETDMNIIKNMEAVFVAALAVAAFATYATAEVAVVAKPTAQVIAEGKIATVVVSTKRLTAAEKARLGS
jgi:hypothetical protein